MKEIKKIIRVLGVDSIFQIRKEFRIEINSKKDTIHFISKENIRGYKLISLCNRINMNTHCFIEYLYISGLIISFDFEKEIFKELILRLNIEV